MTQLRKAVLTGSLLASCGFYDESVMLQLTIPTRYLFRA